MDEPFAALDAITRDVLHEELARLRTSQALTVVFVTHHVREAVRLGEGLLDGREEAVVGCDVERGAQALAGDLERP